MAAATTPSSRYRFMRSPFDREWDYLQPGSSTVWPGGWHLAPPSFGPLLLLPGPKSGSAKAGAADMDRAATARIDASALRRMQTPPRRVLHRFRNRTYAFEVGSTQDDGCRSLQDFHGGNP